ncbi:MAG TPA: alpha-glucosidase [Myxococcaceae bacterium]|nr:alpha-glucosidase [Myxococcaceae bacterium]
MRHLLAAFSLLLLTACSSGEGRLRAEGQGPERAMLGDFELEWSPDAEEGATFRILREGAIVWRNVPGRPFVSGGIGTHDTHEERGHIELEDTLEVRCTDQRLSTFTRSGERVVLSGTLACDDGSTPAWSLQFMVPPEEAQLRFELEVAEPMNRAIVRLASTPKEKHWGFGEQFSWIDLKGAKVPVVVSEQGIGRGAFPITLGANLTAGAGGTWSSTYVAVPHLLTSEGRSLFLEDDAPSFFDLTRPERIEVRLLSNAMEGRVAAGPPMALVEAYTAYAGRMRPLPDWLMKGAVVGIQGGTARVREIVGKLQAADVPLAGVWLQDWVGQRTTSFGKQLWWNWELDRDHYTDWEELRAELEGDGIRVLTYVNTFLAETDEKPNVQRDLFSEAEAAGHLVRDTDGGPYMILNTSFSAGLVDLTSPAATGWLKEVLREQVLAVGASGWMADFGEALPFDSVLHDGTPLEVHNRYPELWARLNREVLDEEGRDDVVFFMRAAYTRSPRYASLFWLGDQLVSWDDSDGLASAVTGLLSGGLSGFTLNHSDIGGYTTIDNPLQNYHRSPELLMRWAEFAAFTPVYRSHEGNIPDRNAQPWDDEVIAHFARMAKVYRALAPYRATLMEEAASTGRPLNRALFLQYPNDPVAERLRNEVFLFGSELLVSPVVTPGAKDVRVWLPRGSWVHLWSGEIRDGGDAGRWHTVDAPLGEPAVFYPAGSEVGEALRVALEAEGLL